MKKVKTIPRLMFEIRPSKALPGEVATFAVRNIKKGAIIADIDSPEEAVILPRRYFKKLDKITQKKINSFAVLDEDAEYCLPADLNNIGTSWYFNHSCSPNVAYDKRGNYVAARNIKKDEELFLDYGWMFDQKFKMKCACGAPNCRGLVTGQDSLNSEFRKKNLERMWPELRKSSLKK
ncbi:MAG: SET domain-containing protein [Candidatus Falkowbacteria bacterium]|nr:SET domain-containing protein [Candidatus Falkowbacteria bacterium]